MVIELNEKDFSKLINDKKNPYVVVDFYADWCGPCRMMAPIIEGISERYSKVKFAKLNVDEASEVSSEYQISSIPCIVFFKNGKEVDRVIGLLNEEVF
ncbi:MAG: thioredoxin, partial [archaeon]|nr:thioredoxin [archaeon]